MTPAIVFAYVSAIFALSLMGLSVNVVIGGASLSYTLNPVPANMPLLRGALVLAMLVTLSLSFALSL